MQTLMVSLNFLLMVVMGTLIALKLTDNTSMSWWWILSPLWVAVVFDLVVMLFAQGKDSVGHIGSFFYRRRRMKEILELPVEPVQPSAAADSATWWTLR